VVRVIVGRGRKAAVAPAAALVVVVVYAVLATQLVGLVWPLPRVLPDTVKFQGQTYLKEDGAGCKSLAEWSRIQQHTPLAAYHTIGYVPSAFYFFRPPMITQLKPDPTYHEYQWFMVRDGDCYFYYAGQFGG